MIMYLHLLSFEGELQRNTEKLFSYNQAGQNKAITNGILYNYIFISQIKANSLGR